MICRCLESLNIGFYDTCVYCYAVTDNSRALRRMLSHDENAPMPTGYPDGTEKVSDRTGRPIHRDYLVNCYGILRGKNMEIYIASSARNLHGVCLLWDALAWKGHTILDWTLMAPPLPDHLSAEERRKVLDSDERGKIFEFCRKACMQAGALIYLGPAGQDAACEVGLAHAAGVPTVGLAAPTEKPGLILSRAVTYWANNVDDCLRYIEELHAR